MQSRKDQSGFSLIELATVLAVMLITTSIAVPALRDMAERNKAATGINWIVRAVRMTRATAITQGSLTTLCPTINRVQCGGKWHGDIMIFTDHNGDRNVNQNDRVFMVMTFPHPGSTLTWRSFQNRQYLQMTALGMTNWQNGNFVYCSADGDLRFARQVVLNIQGRLRKSYDLDGDGLVEDRYGDHLKC